MLDPSHLIQSGGLLLIGAFLFAEVGLFLGFFLPGDTLLIAAGIYAKEGKLSLAAVILVGALAAIAGDSTGYFIGRKLGPRVFRNTDSILFRPDHVAKAEVFYEKRGTKALLVTHFFVIIRTFTPLLAGVAHMPYRRFLPFDVIGDSFWALTVTLVGYYVGSRIPNIDHYIVLGLGLGILGTAAPTLLQAARVIWRHRPNLRHSSHKDKTSDTVNQHDRNQDK